MIFCTVVIISPAIQTTIFHLSHYCGFMQIVSVLTKKKIRPDYSEKQKLNSPK